MDSFSRSAGLAKRRSAAARIFSFVASLSGRLFRGFLGFFTLGSGGGLSAARR
jgi:hypothetical protein